MANTAVTTKPRTITAEQTSEITELFLAWYDLTHEDKSNRAAALRSCKWDTCDAGAFDYCKKILEDGIVAAS